MKLFPRLLGLSLLSLLVGLLLLTSCETSKPGVGETAIPVELRTSSNKGTESRQIAQVTETGTTYKTPRAELASAFIEQFGDGTVIDRVLVQKAPADPQGPVNYFLVGMGLRDGMFRAMALPLNSGGDNTYSLSGTAERYILTSVGCQTCYFNFENGRIMGTSCSDGDGRCSLRIVANNAMFSKK